jgi:hypothetical protein
MFALEYFLILLCLPNLLCCRASGHQQGELGGTAPGRKEPVLIKPGLSVGSLKLGDTRAKAFQLFLGEPQLIHDMVSPGCSTCFNWVDTDNSKAFGNIFVYLKDGFVSQIDSTTTRFSTASGIRPYNTPERVRQRYKGLRAYILSNFTSAAEGDRPLIYWVDRSSGIAFAFAYYPEKHQRYLHAIIVFKPNSDICPIGGRLEPDEKHELPPYTIELPDSTVH